MVDLDERLGHHVKIELPAGSGVATAAISAVTPTEVTLTYFGRAPLTPPAAGDVISCLSAAGHWDAWVLDTGPGLLTLQAPPWLTRASVRRAVRVRASVPVQVDASDWALAGRISDLSVSGAALVVEGSMAPRLDATVQVDLPSGQSRAVVVSRRSHDHPLLKVLGLQWAEPDRATQRWLREAVAARLT